MVSKCSHKNKLFALDYSAGRVYSEYTADTGYGYLYRYCADCKSQMGSLDLEDTELPEFSSPELTKFFSLESERLYYKRARSYSLAYLFCKYTEEKLFRGENLVQDIVNCQNTSEFIGWVLQFYKRTGDDTYQELYKEE